MRRTVTLLCIAYLLGAAAALAQTYPSKPIRFLVPFPPGGSSDLIVRTISPRLGELLGQQVVPDFKGGASGSIGTAEFTRTAPDGYTLLLIWDTHSINHFLYNVSYDPIKSFEPISLILQSPGILVASAKFGPSSVKELIEYARANPERVTYGSAGTGSSNHLSGALFARMVGVRMTHVPYKGGGPLMNDLMGGHVNLVFGTLPLWAPQVEGGKIKALAVLDKVRSPHFPDVPCTGEVLPGFEARTWFGVMAPAGTPKEIVARLNREFSNALNDPQVKPRLVSRGFDIVASTPEALTAHIHQESEVWGKLIRELGVKAD